jgi:hypothetical protein
MVFRPPLQLRPEPGDQPLSLLESALPKNAPVTPLQSALIESLDLKSFRIRTYKIRRGEGYKLLTEARSRGWAH